MRSRWRVAVLDSGLVAEATRSSAGPMAQRSQPQPIAACRFVDTGREVRTAPAVSDPFGHGTSVSAIICGASRPMELLVGQVLDHRGVTTAAALAAAIAWSLEEGANLIHMSLGLREDRAVLADAVAGAVKAGCIVVASTPARGAATFPSGYPQVIRATGDARCQRDEISELSSAQADFGGCPRPQELGRGSSAHQGGASLGAAHLTRFLVDRVAPGSDLTAVRAELCSLARYHGIERRVAAQLPAN